MARRAEAFVSSESASTGPGYLFYPDGLDIDVFRDWEGAIFLVPYLLPVVHNCCLQGSARILNTGRHFHR